MNHLYHRLFWMMILLITAVPTAAAADWGVIMKSGRFVSYTPRNFSVVNGQPRQASPADISEDLKLLRKDFDCLITYSCANGLDYIPESAAKLNYMALIIGIWDPTSDIEMQRAVHLAIKYSRLIVAIAVGNEGIYARRYSPAEIEKTIAYLRKELPSVWLTTSEPFFLYLQPDYFEFFNRMDLLLPNIHPTFEKWFNPSDALNAAAFVVNVADKLQSQYPKPLIVKETGLPSGPVSMGFTEERQSAFWNEILTRFVPSKSRAVSCFEAFDAPWKPAVMKQEYPGKDHIQEAYWGMYTVEAKPKPVISIIRLIRGKL